MIVRKFTLLLMLVLLMTACGESSAPTVTDPPAAPTLPPATSTPAATATPQNTSTPQPTATPANTATPKPTATEAPTATPLIPTATPEPIVFQGKGQTVTDPQDIPQGVYAVRFIHDGKRNFIVTMFDADGNEDHIVNAIGRYVGVRPVFGAKGVFFEVKADGGWSIMFETFPIEIDAAVETSGSGDNVSGLFRPAKTGNVPYHFTHNGKSNFIVHITCAGGDDYAQNEIGKVDGTAIVRIPDEEGVCFWDVKADGDWTIKRK